LLATGAGSEAFSDEKAAELKLWDVRRGKEIASFPGHKWCVWSLAFAPDGKLLASAGSDSLVKLWDVEGQKELFSSPPLGGPLLAVVISPDGKHLAAAGGSKVALWDLPARKQQAILPIGRGGVQALAFSPDGRTLAAGSNDNLIRLWEVPGGRPLATLRGHASWVNALAFSPDGGTLISGGADKAIKLWDLKSRKVRAGFRNRDHMEISALALAPDGKTLAWGTYRLVQPKAAPFADAGLVRFLNLDTRKPRTVPIPAPNSGVSGLAFAPQRPVLATAHKDHTVRLWDVSALVPPG
jgi:WD40 repeat protein